jgi:predicted TIM-barrel fold metal-dependent hydrolase
MDLAGVFASLNFPSILIGFAGQRFMRFADKNLGLACMRAYNDWIIEEWKGSYPDRFIAAQVAWLLDADVAAAEIYRNAARGFRGVAFTENPEKLGLPSLYSDYWDPFFRACEDTDTVVNLHLGSSSQTLQPSTESPMQVVGILSVVNALASCVDWMFTPVPLKFPGIKIAISEGGIGWVPMLMDRIRYMERGYFGEIRLAGELTPEEILRRNFWFTMLYDPSALRCREDIGMDRVMMEVDYPHSDSTWPHSQKTIEEQIASFTQHDRDRLTYLNACLLYRHPCPPESFLHESPSGDAGGEKHGTG